MNQKICLGILLGMVVLMSLVFTNVLVRADPLEIVFEQNPFPGHAGEQSAVSFHITNNGNTNLTNVKFSLDVDSPLILRSASEKTLSIQAGETKTITYTVYVEDDADEGKETITLDYTIDTNNYDQDFDFQIASNQVFLQVEQVTSNPESVTPGETVTVTIQVKNTASSEIKDVVLGLDLTNLPFAPESITEKQIGSIGENGKTSVSFNLIVLLLKLLLK